MSPQVKLTWTNLPPACATWEHLYAVVTAFPEAPAWGQAGSLGGGIVTTLHLPKAIAVTRRIARKQEIKEAHLALRKKGPGSSPRVDTSEPTC